MPGNGTDISEQLVRNISARAEASIGSVLMLQQKILQWLRERRSQEASIRDGIGEASFANLCKSIDRRHGEQISYCEISKEVFEDMGRTGLLKNGALRTYTAMQAANSDAVLLFYGSKDQHGMNLILDAMDAMYGRRAAVDRESFEMLSEGKDLYVLDGLREEDVELLSCFAGLPAACGIKADDSSVDRQNADGMKKDEMKIEPFPYTVIESKNRHAAARSALGQSVFGNSAGSHSTNSPSVSSSKDASAYDSSADSRYTGTLSVVCLAEDSHKLAGLMGYVAAAATSEHGARILEQVQFRIKGRQERNIAIDEAEKNQVIMDAENPRNMIKVTAKDYEFYKNNKIVEAIPRSGPLNRVYDLVEGMSEAVILDADRIKSLPASQQQEAAANMGTPISSLHGRNVDVDMQDVFRQLEREEDVRAYLKTMSGITVKADPYGTLDHALRKARKEQRRMDRDPLGRHEDRSTGWNPSGGHEDRGMDRDGGWQLR